jgi:Staphylococcal nuclease homologue
MRALALLLFSLTTSPVLAACGRAQPQPLPLASISPSGELTLQDGRRLRLAGIEERPDATLQELLTPWLTRQPLQVEWLTKAADRWGRFTIRAFAPDRAGELMSVNEALIDAGLARVEIDPLARPCLGALLKLEDEARAAKRGLWREDKFKPLSATDRAGLLERRGEQVIVEGRIVSVGQTRSQTYLNFGHYRSYDFAIVLDRRVQNSFDSTGTKVSALTGKTVRVRGLLDVRLGPHIQIHDAEALEMTRATGAVSPKSGDRIKP